VPARLRIGLVVALGGVAGATIPDSAGVIHGCYVTSTGQLRVIDSVTATTCNSDESSLEWSQAGPTGATGATRAKGAVGATGGTGAKGVSGAKGDRGPSDAFTTGQSHGAVKIGKTAVLVRGLSLPAGKYAVTAQTDVETLVS
jgi:hypothetical protein